MALMVDCAVEGHSRLGNYDEGQHFIFEVVSVLCEVVGLVALSPVPL